MSLAKTYTAPVSLPGVGPPTVPRDQGAWASHLTSLQQWAQQLQAGSWITPALVNGWANFGSGYTPAGFRADLSGRVYLRGLLAGNANTLPSTIFTLPWTPQFHQLLPAFAQSTTAYTGARLDVDTAGNVILQSLLSGTWGAAGMLSLDGLSFSLSP